MFNIYEHWQTSNEQLEIFHLISKIRSSFLILKTRFVNVTRIVDSLTVLSDLNIQKKKISQFRRAVLLSTSIFLYAFCSIFNGYTGGALYSQLGGKDDWILHFHNWIQLNVFFSLRNFLDETINLWNFSSSINRFCCRFSREFNFNLLRFITFNSIDCYGKLIFIVDRKKNFLSFRFVSLVLDCLLFYHWVLSVRFLEEILTVLVIIHVEPTPFLDRFQRKNGTQNHRWSFLQLEFYRLAQFLLKCKREKIVSWEKKKKNRNSIDFRYFIFTSFWAYKVKEKFENWSIWRNDFFSLHFKIYFVYEFMFLVFLLLTIVTACVTIVAIYFLLNSEDYRW